jgi:hypothetical protein
MTRLKTTPASSFTCYEDFVPVFNAARQAAIAEFGERWSLHPQAYVWARLPAEWVRVQVAGKRTPDLLPPSRFVSARSGAGDWSSLPARDRLSDEIVGTRWSTAPRDQKLPVARFWPGGELPIGPEYAAATS